MIFLIYLKFLINFNIILINQKIKNMQKNEAFDVRKISFKDQPF